MTIQDYDRILECLRDEGPMNTKELAERIFEKDEWQRSKSKTLNILYKLSQAGKIRKCGVDENRFVIWGSAE